MSERDDGGPAMAKSEAERAAAELARRYAEAPDDAWLPIVDGPVLRALLARDRRAREALALYVEEDDDPARMAERRGPQDPVYVHHSGVLRRLARAVLSEDAEEESDGE